MLFASEESVEFVKLWKELKAHYEALLVSRDEDILKMVDALESTCVFWSKAAADSHRLTALNESLQRENSKVNSELRVSRDKHRESQAQIASLISKSQLLENELEQYKKRFNLIKKVLREQHANMAADVAMDRLRDLPFMKESKRSPSPRASQDSNPDDIDYDRVDDSYMEQELDNSMTSRYNRTYQRRFRQTGLLGERAMKRRSASQQPVCRVDQRQILKTDSGLAYSNNDNFVTPRPKRSRVQHIAGVETCGATRYSKKTSSIRRSISANNFFDNKTPMTCLQNAFVQSSLEMTTPSIVGGRFVAWAKGQPECGHNFENFRGVHTCAVCTKSFCKDCYKDLETNANLMSGSSDRCASITSADTPMDTFVSYDTRPHLFEKRRNFFKINSCAACNASIGFSCIFIKCLRCKGQFHESCRLKVSMPCITWVNPPKLVDGKGMRLRLGDFCPNERPMIPPLIAYCVYFLNRGTCPNDLYENSGNEAEVEAIGKLFRASTNNVKLDGFSKVSVAAAIKKFLHEIREPLIPSSYAKEFVQAATSGSLDAFPRLVNDLPTAHMDALACLCRHWRLYLEADQGFHLTADMVCRRIASVIFGLRETTHNQSTPNQHQANNNPSISSPVMLNENTAQLAMKNLLEFPVDFWTEMLNNIDSYESSRAHTPLMRNPSGRSTISMKTTSSSNSRYPNVNFD